MANDTSARPHELLNLRIKDIIFKTSESGVQYAEIQVSGNIPGPFWRHLIQIVLRATDLLHYISVRAYCLFHPIDFLSDLRVL